MRWALAHKGVTCEYIHVELLNGEVEQPPHRARNPMGYVPTLEVTLPGQKPFYLSESMAIIEWLEENFSKNPLLPPATEKNGLTRARARQLFELINAGTQPLQNLTTLEMVDTLTGNSEARKAWAKRWNEIGLTAFEALIASEPGPFCQGDRLTIADLALIPQVYNALRFEVDLKAFPRCEAIYRHCRELPSCQAAGPEKFQPAN